MNFGDNRLTVSMTIAKTVVWMKESLFIHKKSVKLQYNKSK